MATIKVNGSAELQAKLLRLGRFSELRGILLEGAEAAEQVAKPYAPGSIQRLFRARPVKNERVAMALMGIDMKLSTRPADKHGRRVRYPYIVEYGSKPHLIRSEKPMPLGGKFARVVNHPGFAGLKYFARGVRAARSPVKRLLEDRLVETARKFDGA